jgi:valyl-tRNA synthetase
LSKKELDVTKKFLTAIRLIRDFRIKNSISSKVVMSIYTSDIASFFLPLLSQLNIELVGNLNGGIKIIEKSIEVTIFNQASNLEKLNQKLLKHFDELKFEISRSAKILSNKAFLQNANKDKVNLEKKKYQQYLEEFNKIKKAMNK